MTHSTSIARFVPYMTEQFSMADFITTAFLKGGTSQNIRQKQYGAAALIFLLRQIPRSS